MCFTLLHQFMASIPVIIHSTLEECRVQSVHNREEVASIEVKTVDIIRLWEVVFDIFMFEGEPEHLMH